MILDSKKRPLSPGILVFATSCRENVPVQCSMAKELLADLQWRLEGN